MNRQCKTCIYFAESINLLGELTGFCIREIPEKTVYGDGYCINYKKRDSKKQPNKK